MHGTSSISHWVETGLVVSGVDATSMRSILLETISSLATSAARFGLDWLSFTATSTGKVARADLDAALYRVEEIGNDEIVGFAKCRERPGLRANIADLEALRGMHRGCEYRTGRKRGAWSPLPS